MMQEAESATQDFFLGIDSGLNHTEAIVADRYGKILGRGRGGASNHTKQSDGRESLRDAIIKSVGEALGVVAVGYVREFEFASAHCAVTGGDKSKVETIGEVLNARVLQVGQDIQASLYGAMGGKTGIVIIAGTGSVAYGEDEYGNAARTGGWGHLFSDEGSGFWMATQSVRRALKAQDGLADSTLLTEKLLEYFKCKNLHELTMKVYSEEITRDYLASFSREIYHVAMLGDKAAVQIVESSARLLSVLAVNTAAKLRFNERINVAMMGSVFGSKLTRMFFSEALKQSLPSAKTIEARFGASVGALLLAYRQANVELTEELLSNLEESSR